jgi:hypothetical protein
VEGKERAERGRAGKEAGGAKEGGEVGIEGRGPGSRLFTAVPASSRCGTGWRSFPPGSRCLRVAPRSINKTHLSLAFANP